MICGVHHSSYTSARAASARSTLASCTLISRFGAGGRVTLKPLAPKRDPLNEPDCEAESLRWWVADNGFARPVSEGAAAVTGVVAVGMLRRESGLRRAVLGALVAESFPASGAGQTGRKR